MAIIVKTHKPVIFIHNKRAGGSSISTWLKQNFDGYRAYGKHHKFSKLNEFDQKLGLSFAVVRNPWERCVSAYFYQKRKIDERTAKILRGKTRKYKIHEIEETKKQFDKEFHEWLIENQNWNYLTVSQQSVIEGVDIVLRFENLIEDFKKIQTYLECFEPLSHKNTSTHNPYRDYYTQEAADIVAEKCKIDIERFNYRF